MMKQLQVKCSKKFKIGDVYLELRTGRSARSSDEQLAHNPTHWPITSTKKLFAWVDGRHIHLER